MLSSNKKDNTNPKFESFENFGDWLYNLPNPAAVHTDGIFVYVNKAALKLFKAQSSKDLLGKPIRNIIHPEFIPNALERIKYVYVTGKSSPAIIGRLIDLNGEELIVELSGGLITFNKKPSVLVTMRNITEQIKAESAIIESEKRYRGLFENSTELIQSVSTQGKFLYVNNAWLKTFGYKKSEVKNLHINQIIHPDQLDHCMMFWQRVLSGKSFKNLETTFVKKNGEPVEIKGSSGPRKLDDGSIATQGIFQNITLNKQAELKLKKSEENYRTLVENMNEGIIKVNLDEIIEYVNVRFCEIVGYKKRELIGRNSLEIIVADGRSGLKIKKATALRKKGISSRYEVRHKTKAGDWIWLSMNGSPVYDNEDKVVGSIGIVTDITEAKRAEWALKDSEEKFRLISENVPDIIFLVNRKGQIQHINRVLSGFNLKDVIGSSILNYIPIKYHQLHKKKINEVFNKAVSTSFNTEGMGANSEKRWYFNHICPLTRDGKVVSVVYISRDVTEHKLAEQSIKHLNEHLEQRVAERTFQLEKANKEIKTLLREMHHRVKNNLQIVSSLLNIQASEITDPSVSAAFKESQDRIQTMAFIHENLYMKESMSEINIKEYLKSLLKDRIKANSTGKRKIDLKTNFPDINFKIDTMLPLGLMLNEMTTNSLKHAFPHRHKGSINVSIRKTKGKEYLFDYSDNGIGFSKIDAHRAKHTLGILLIETFALQLEGIIKKTSNSKGTRYRVKFILQTG